MAHARVRFCLPVTTVVLLVAAWPSQLRVPVEARQDSRQKQVLVTVMDLRTGRPATGVTADSVVVREDGQERTVVSVQPAASPVAVVLLADTTDAFTRYVRELRGAAQAFLTPLLPRQAGAIAALWEFGGEVVQLETFTADAAPLIDGIARLRPRDQVAGVTEARSNLLTAVYDAARALGKRAESRRVVVSFNATTPLEVGKITRQQLQNELRNNAVSWFAVTLNDGGSSSPLRDTVMTEVLPWSGGLRLTVTDVSRLEAAMTVLAEALAAQMVVTWARPSGAPAELQIEARGEGLRAFAPRWAPR